MHSNIYHNNDIILLLPLQTICSLSQCNARVPESSCQGQGEDQFLCPGTLSRVHTVCFVGGRGRGGEREGRRKKEVGERERGERGEKEGEGGGGGR